MPYIGHSPTNAGSFIEIDDFSSTFNGAGDNGTDVVAFTLQVGGVDITPNTANVLVMLDGVLQQPPAAYSISGSTITFTEAPASGTDLYAVLIGQSASVGQGTVGASELKVSGNGSSGQVLASDGDGTFTWTTDTENYLPLAGGALTGAVTTNSTFDGVDIATRDGVLTSTTTTANAALPKAGGTMTGNITLGSNDNIYFGDTGEKIYGNGTHLYIASSDDLNLTSAGNFTVDSNADINLDSNDGKIYFKDGGTAFAKIHSDADGGGILLLDSDSGTSGISQIRSDTDRASDGGHMFRLQAYNQSTEAAAMWILRGSTDAKADIVFNTSNAERLRIDEDGNVGIGITSPQSHNVTNAVHIGSDHELGFGDGANSRPDFGIAATGSGGSAKLNIYCGEGSDTVDMAITPSGWLGIGTDSPSASLEVVGSTDYAQIKLTDTDSDNTVQRTGILSQHYDSDEQDIRIIGMYNSDTTSNVQIGGGSGDHNSAELIQFFTSANHTTLAGTLRMIIDGNGHVGFGGNDTPNNQVSNCGGKVIELYGDDNGAFDASTTASWGNVLNLHNQDDTAGSNSVLLFTGRSSSKGYAGIASTQQGNDAQDLRFFTRGGSSITERLKIAHGGLSTFHGAVSMGATNASDQLYVGSGAFPSARINNMAGGEGGIRMRSYQDGSNQVHADLLVQETGGNEGGYFAIRIPYTTERMRIDSSGQVGIGGSASGAHLHIFADMDNSSSWGIRLKSTVGNGTAYMQEFRDGSNDVCGNITIATSDQTCAYTSGSDYRIKTNVEEMTGSIERLEKIKPYKYNTKKNAEGIKLDGFYAHELAEIIPEAVVGEKDAVDEDGEMIIQGIDYGRITPLLVSALQEAIERIKVLENA